VRPSLREAPPFPQSTRSCEPASVREPDGGTSGPFQSCCGVSRISARRSPLAGGSVLDLVARCRLATTRRCAIERRIGGGDARIEGVPALLCGERCALRTTSRCSISKQQLPSNNSLSTRMECGRPFPKPTECVPTFWLHSPHRSSTYRAAADVTRGCPDKLRALGSSANTAAAGRVHSGCSLVRGPPIRDQLFHVKRPCWTTSSRDTPYERVLR
jgi:hypothetical protein